MQISFLQMFDSYNELIFFKISGDGKEQTDKGKTDTPPTAEAEPQEG